MSDAQLQSNNDRPLDLCRHQVEKSRPFFIGIREEIRYTAPTNSARGTTAALSARG